ncbi:MAG: YihY/virulence factor BrkB family protein [bacterium]|nr:YihY/virulence factor BrkB family protein [bacterium]
MMPHLKVIFNLFKRTYLEWNDDNIPRLAAALAYYITFSLAPLLVLTIAIVGFVLQRPDAHDTLVNLVNETIGLSAGSFISGLIEGIRQPQSGVVSTVLSVLALFFGALAVFEQLKGALNTIWHVPKEKIRGGIRGFLFNKLISFTMIIMLGFLMAASLLLTGFSSIVESFVLSIIPSAELPIRVAHILFSFALVTILFAIIYRILPDITLQWRDVWVGAMVTMLLFNLGRFVLGLYLSNSGTASLYGAAGSFVLILLWIYYSALIVLFGAKFTQVYSITFGSLRDIQAIKQQVLIEQENASNG